MDLSKVTITMHAVDQYRERVRPDLSYDQAHKELLEDIKATERGIEKGESGAEYWFCTRSNCRFVMARQNSDRAVWKLVVDLKTEEIINSVYLAMEAITL